MNIISSCVVCSAKLCCFVSVLRFQAQVSSKTCCFLVTRPKLHFQCSENIMLNHTLKSDSALVFLSDSLLQLNHLLNVRFSCFHFCTVAASGFLKNSISPGVDQKNGTSGGFLKPPKYGSAKYMSDFFYFPVVFLRLSCQILGRIV